jgi:phosphosulfolactate synthase (CoM biosynthesis protein A)
MQQLLLQGPEAMKTYLREARDLGFDALELDMGRVVMEPNEALQLIEDVQQVRHVCSLSVNLIVSSV